MKQNIEAIRESAAQLLSVKMGKKMIVDSLSTVSGGCINECYEVSTTDGKFFLKQNTAGSAAAMFECEVKGLELLNNAVAGISPAVIYCTTDKLYSGLMLEWIEPGKSSPDFWHHFAQQLSLLHQHTQPLFGLDHDNFIGSLPQNNSFMDSWNSFFILCRIEPQLKKAIDGKKLPKEIHTNFEKLFSKLHDFFPVEKPAFLHGDLWSGNFLTTVDGKVRLIDPAVYYGHREMDLSMAKLFGGFDRSFYSCYQDYFPMEKGYEQRMTVQQLYPLLVHLNLFGAHYATEVATIIKRFG
ncbi:MAG: fructosamine kinase family protein [Chitinophagales bacterium]